MRFVIVAFLLLIAATSFAEKRFIDRLPSRSETIDSLSYGSMTAAMSEVPLHRIEGVWQFPATGVEIAILRESILRGKTAAGETLYKIIIISSPNRATRPGTVMGLISAAAKSGEYEANIYTNNIGSTLTLPKKFTLSLIDNDSSIEFRRHRSSFSINLWRLLPYVWRNTVRPNMPERKSDGCIRVFPEPSLPREPIYL